MSPDALPNSRDHHRHPQSHQYRCQTVSTTKSGNWFRRTVLRYVDANSSELRVWLARHECCEKENLDYLLLLLPTIVN